MLKKTLNWMAASTLAFCALSLLPSCSKDDDNTNTGDMYNISATMNGAAEFPNPVTTAGTGTTTGTYNAANNTLTYSVTWTGLSGPATAGHFHSPALPGANASPLVYFLIQNNGNAGVASGSAVLSDAQEADLLGGKFYANIHTAANPGGEIRGQVAAAK